MQKYHNNVQDQFGNAIGSVTVTVRTNPGGVIATIYSDDGITTKSNPFTNDSDGEFFFYAANGRYDVELTGAAIDTKEDVLLQDVLVGVADLTLKADINTATPPTTEAVTAQLDYVDNDETDVLAQIGFNASNTIRIANRMHGGNIQLNGEDTSGNARVGVDVDPDAGVTLRYLGANIIRADTQASGVFAVRSDGNTDAEGRRVQFQHQDGTLRGWVGYTTSDTLQLRSNIHGAQVTLGGEDAGGVFRTLFSGDPDGTTSIYNAGTVVARTTANGVFEILGDADNDTDVRILRYHYANGTERGAIGYGGDDILAVRNAVHGGNIEISAEDAGGVARTFLTGDPDGQTTLTGDVNVQVQVNAGTKLAIECNNDGNVELYYNDQLQFRTAAEAGADIGMGAEVRHNDDAFYPVGMNVVPEEDALDTGNVTLSQAQVGKMLTYNSATARSLFFNNDGNIKVGAMWALKVGPSGGTLTGDGGTGVQIRWWNGSGWTTTAAAGNITIGVGSYTIWKETDTLYWIDGPTLS